MSQMLEPGTVLAERYRIIRLIGVGGMGAVFEAENMVTHKRVAVKWLQPLVADRPESAQRLLREAQAASRVRHPNVVDVYDVVRDGDTLFLVLELLEGEPLEHVFERESMSLPDLMRVLAQAMRGVAAAHKQGVIHRDLHPGNIFIVKQPDSGQFTAKVLDFGISKFAGNDSMNITQPGMTLGTPLYMSFEQLRGEPNIDSRADVYSFGVIIYEALTGRLPFEASSLPELAIKFATSTPSSVRSLRPAIPEPLDRAISTALARDREQRLPNMDALIREVEAFAAVAESRSRSAEDLLGLTEERQPHQIVTLGRQNRPDAYATPAPSESPLQRRIGLTWTVTMVGAVAAAGLSAWLVVSLRGRPKPAAQPPPALEVQTTPLEPRVEPPTRTQRAPDVPPQVLEPSREQPSSRKREAEPERGSAGGMQLRAVESDEISAPEAVRRRKAARGREAERREREQAQAAGEEPSTGAASGEPESSERKAPAANEAGEQAAPRELFRAGPPPTRDDF